MGEFTKILFNGLDNAGHSADRSRGHSQSSRRQGDGVFPPVILINLPVGVVPRPSVQPAESSRILSKGLGQDTRGPRGKTHSNESAQHPKRSSGRQLAELWEVAVPEILGFGGALQ